MKSSCLLLVCLSAASPLAQAGTFAHVRSIDPWAPESLERGMSHSPLVRELVATLEASDVIVHIQTTTSLPFDTAGQTQLVHSAGGYRYVRIAVARGLAPDSRTAILGHELQHACEIARSRAVDSESVRELFLSIGHMLRGSTNAFETPEAMRTTIRVWSELRTGTSSRER